MDYPTLRILHVLAAATWVGGMLGSGLAVVFHGALASTNGRSVVASLRRWNRWVTTPAMLAMLVAGFTIALQGGWLDMAWLRLKLALVLALALLHGALSRALRRMTSTQAAPPALLRFAVPVTAVLALCVVALALTKVF